MVPEEIMIILWIRKHKTDKDNSVREAESFKEHDDVMKRFRLAHRDITSTSSREIVTNEGNLLAPVHQVKLAENVQN
jgi:hypothetical protein